MKNNKFGIISVFFVISALLMTTYTVSSYEMNDELTETPIIFMTLHMLFIKNDTVKEPSFSSIGLFPLIDEDKRYFSNLLSVLLSVSGGIFALLAYARKEYSLLYATAFFTAGSTLALLSIKAFILFVVILASSVAFIKKHKRI